MPKLFNEIQSIVDRGVPMPKILVSDRAQMVMSYHKNFDAYEEERLGENLSVPQIPESHRSIQTNIQRSAFR